MVHNEKAVREGTFKVLDSHARKYACEKGDMMLTTGRSSLNCEGSWSESFPILEVDLVPQIETLEIYGGLYRNFWLKLIIGRPKEWKEAHREVSNKHMIEVMRRVSEAQEKRPIELRRIFDIGAERLKKLYHNTRKERLQFERKNIGFNLDIWDSLEELKNRKLKAFVIAHSYVAWYEWIKRLLNKIYRAKF